MPRYTKAEIKEARENLLRFLKPGGIVYTILAHVSRSGMQRVIRVVVLDAKNGEIVDWHPNWAVGVLTGRRVRQGWQDGIVCNGCGMDMGFELIDNLSRALGVKLQQRWL